MSVPRSVAEVLADHVTLEVEGIDRMYLNVYVPGLQREQGVACFFRFHRGNQFVSSALMDPISKTFVAALEAFARKQKIPVIAFGKGQRKDDVSAEQRKKFQKTEGVVFIGKAQEKTRVFRTERRRNEKTGGTYPWLVRSTATVNHFYIYCVDRDFGPFFLKFSTYFPYNAKLCLGFEALDNGVLRCDDPKRLQAICDGLSAEKIDALLRKWLRLLPHPDEARDRMAGYRYQISILQAEFSLTQVLDRPVTGWVFFEEVIRENLDIGRPSQVRLIFDRRVNKTTPGRFRTRVITDGVIPSLHVDYKSTRIKQYHKQGIVRPAEVDGQRASALRFGDKRVQALFTVLAVFSLQLRGFTNSEMRVLLAQLLGFDPADYSVGKLTYDLRRLWLHGIIERIPHSHRYHLTSDGLRIALFFSGTYNRPPLSKTGSCSLK